MFGKTATEAGIGWYEYRYIERTRAGSTGLITFAYVATHNHFARLVERVVTNQHGDGNSSSSSCDAQHEANPPSSACSTVRRLFLDAASFLSESSSTRRHQY